ncbi:hypothetical protein LIP_2244 [Limnochorda pilosa]|uniref:Uncharacterized protein n=1 Tax=Limnochorda pilosa TaxID=1555112 RepID=A0A0K2SLV6_LIMPI|nr:glycosyltransferase family 4 protein [Limnochorda pilosa]BAS28085.1 hypothetical protein LIP_2244 [Limnochorda pilosa]
MVSRLRVLLLTEYFYPDEASTGRLLGELFLVIKQRRPAWTVDVVTGRRPYRATNHNPLPRREEWEDIRIRRYRTLRAQSDGFARRAASDLVFSASAALSAALLQYDVLFVVTNPPLMPMVLNLLGSARRPTVYLIHDLYPDVPVALGLWRRESRFTRTLRRLQARSLQRSERVVVLGDGMKDFLVQEYGVPSGKIAVIPNWTTMGLGKPRTAPASDGEFVVLYSGNIGRFQDFHTLLEGAERLRDHSTIRFEIAGDGARAIWLRNEARNRGLSNMVFRPYLRDAEYTQTLRRASLGLITLEPGMEALGVPSKTYNLLAAGLPLIAVLGPESDVARIIATHGVGYRVDHGDAEAFSRSIVEAAADPDRYSEMSLQAIEYVNREATLDVAVERYVEEIERAAMMGRAHVAAPS